jgi:hypothetical protein
MYELHVRHTLTLYTNILVDFYSELLNYIDLPVL